MKSETDLAVQQQEIRPENVLQAIILLSRDKDARIDVIERLVALQERQEAKQAEKSFMAALAALQAEVPLIHRGGLNKFTGNKYARREDIFVVLQPLLAKHGFAFSFNEESREGDMCRFSGKLSHRDGHFEIKYKTLQTDTAAKNKEGKPTRTGIQDDGSTSSYAQRYLFKMHLNMAETDEDTDGNSAEKITDEQAKDLKDAVEQIEMDRGRFFVFMGVGDYDEILASDWKKALNAIDTKRRENEEKAALKAAKEPRK